MERNNSNLSFMITQKYNLPKSTVIVANKNKTRQDKQKNQTLSPQKSKNQKTEPKPKAKPEMLL